MRLSDFNKFIYRINKDELKSYFQQKTTFTLRQINEFVSLLVHKDGRYNLWEKPLISINNYYLLPLVTSISPNTFLMIDTWIEEGGFSLGNRGKMMESYIKKQIAEKLNKKSYYFKISEASTFYNQVRDYEEIDLVLNLKHIVVFAEVKCIKYPMEARDYHNALNRLREGAEQISRKSNFITKNILDFEDKIGKIDGKSIVKLVITNYPLFTGLKLCNVPIVDFYLLESYISSGGISRRKIVTNNGKVVESEETEKIIFYSNEDEFSENLQKNMESPVAVTKCFNLFEIIDKKISIDSSNYQIFLQCATAVD